MNVLTIDCSEGLKVCLKNDSKTFEKIDYALARQTSSLLAVVDELLGKAKITIKDVDYIAVCVGPGSFTGIRVAISTAKGLAIGSGAKVVSVNEFEIVQEEIADKNFCVISTGFGENYYYHFKKFGRVFEGCLPLDKIMTMVGDTLYYSDSQNLADKLAEKNIKVNVVNYNALAVAEKKIADGMIIETNQIAPLYLRASQAEIERQKNGNN
jgi:tRNA threonylcarbamoyladenosine biosynthesis protein TsaB